MRQYNTHGVSLLEIELPDLVVYTAVAKSYDITCAAANAACTLDSVGWYAQEARSSLDSTQPLKQMCPGL